MITACNPLLDYITSDGAVVRFHLLKSRSLRRHRTFFVVVKHKAMKNPVEHFVKNINSPIHFFFKKNLKSNGSKHELITCFKLKKHLDNTMKFSSEESWKTRATIC